MPRTRTAQANASQKFTLPDGKIIVSRALLQEILGCLLFTTPIIGGKRPPERHWSMIKSMRLFHAKKLLRQMLSEGDK